MVSRQQVGVIEGKAPIAQELIDEAGMQIAEKDVKKWRPRS